MIAHNGNVEGGKHEGTENYGKLPTHVDVCKIQNLFIY